MLVLHGVHYIKGSDIKNISNNRRKKKTQGN